MLVSHAYRFIYLKTRKTAGTSTEMALEQFARDDAPAAVTEKTAAIVSAAGIVGERRQGNGAREAPDDWWSHKPAREVRALLGASVWEAYLKFCNVRNPWDRVVSRFFWTFGRHNRVPSDAVAAFRGWIDGPKALTSDWDVFTIDDAPAVDAVVRHHALEADLTRVAARLGLPPLTLPRAKAGLRPGVGYTDFYDDAAREKVARAYGNEIDLFGWTFDSPVPARVAGSRLDPGLL